MLDKLTQPVKIAISDAGMEGRCPNAHAQLVTELKTRFGFYEKIILVPENTTEEWVIQIRTLNCDLEYAPEYVQQYSFNFGNDSSGKPRKIDRQYRPVYAAVYSAQLVLLKSGLDKPVSKSQLDERETFQISLDDPTWSVPPQAELTTLKDGVKRPQIALPAPSATAGGSFPTSWRRYGAETHFQSHWAIFEELTERQVQRIADRTLAQVAANISK